MIIPPSAMLIIYSFVAEQSIGQMFLAGIVPGIMLAVAYILAILAMGRLTPKFIGGPGITTDIDLAPTLGGWEIVSKVVPIVLLVAIVLGGIYAGFLSPVEAGAAGSLVALIITILRRRMSLKAFWRSLIETGHITATILFLITAASMYSRMLGIAGLPNEFGDFLEAYEFGFVGILVIYVILMLFLGTLLDTASIVLIVVPLFLPILEPMGISLVWFGIITVIGAEIGLLTPPLGISCFVIHSTLSDPRIALKDVFLGALPFAVVMLAVLILLIRYPQLSIGILP
jgi:tripartite ATP-independent transporter DctM subunit